MSSASHRAVPRRAHVAEPAPKPGRRRAERAPVVAGVVPRRAAALALVAATVLLFLHAREVRFVEAWFQAQLLHGGGIPSQRVGSAVLVDVQGKLAGINLTTGCSTGPLLGVFLGAAAPFVWYRALSLSRLLVAVGQLTALLVLANQVRIAAIVISMRHWGFQRGYDFSHVFLGSTITTVGFVAGLVLFVRLVAAQPKVAGA